MADESERAVSEVTGHLLMVIIMVIAAIIILQSVHMPELDWEYTEQYTEPPVIFSITSIKSISPTFESRILLRNIVKKDFKNRELSAKIYRNGELLPCTIETLNTHEFTSTVHYGAKLLWGQGGSGDLWNYNQMLGMDLSDRFIHPGDIIRVDIIETATDTVISRDSMEA
ncbi:hypothetical protein [Methanogenium sp. MK-MG]|uniref:hypothetical protein n=1 Tax=Methanogenium sp. MK-MG TaxID=2599926 RepID=UPI0013EB45C7|nr:hypothetical protein [Methanogenium sp. MK-MG]KAF1076950.1 hypothetical protein MKMG_01375 [Methanogenium sp. MK-MG]